MKQLELPAVCGNSLQGYPGVVDELTLEIRKERKPLNPCLPVPPMPGCLPPSLKRVSYWRSLPLPRQWKSTGSPLPNTLHPSRGSLHRQVIRAL